MKAFVGWLMLASVCFGQEREVGEAVANLPEGVTGKAGALSLVADFENAADGVVPLYVINGTKKPVVFIAQDGDIYLKMEFKDKDGGWKRAQTHQSSWCGNSYLMRPKLSAGTFLKVSGMFPEKGEAAEVRYRCYGNHNIHSNVGRGFYDPMAAFASEVDDMGLRDADFDKLRKIALGEVMIPKAAQGWQDKRAVVMHRLSNGEFDKKEVRVLMQRLAEDPDEKVSAQAKDYLERVKVVRPAVGG